MSYKDSFNEIYQWHQVLRRTHSGLDIIRAIEHKVEHESDPVRLRILKFLLADEYIAQGNQAAADAVRLQDPVMEIHDWHNEWRRTHPGGDIIPVVEERIRRESHPSKLSQLRSILACEHRNRGHFAASEAIFLHEFSQDPEEPMPLIDVANQKLYYEDQPEAAMPFIDRAIEVALRFGTFRRLALGVKARIALRLEAYHIVEEVMKQIMQLKYTRGNADIRAERDFLECLPPGSIDPDVARQYDEFWRKRQKPKGTSAS